MSEYPSASAPGADQLLRMPPRSYWFLAAAFLLLTIAAALRVHHLGERSLWFDEALTANTSRSTLTHMLDATRARGSAPVVHPYILYLVEKVEKSAAAVRAPSVLASLLAVLLMLAMVRANVSQTAALFAATILGVSASQIRYAQEVREYSLSVLFATILIYCLLRWEAVGSRNRHPVLLYFALFSVPLIQYGLVLFAAAILCTIVLRLILAPETRFGLFHVVVASVSLAAGGLASFLLTLRYQFHPGQGQWYLASNYFDHKAMSLLGFLGSNTKGLLSFFIPGQVVTLCLLVAAFIFCVSQALNRRFDTITIVVFTSIGITVCASLARLYPYGGIRQCLFLSPGVILFAGVAFDDLVNRIRGSWQPFATACLLALILLSAYRGMLKQWPYAEYEDTVSILKELHGASAPSDQVWVNHDAVEAVDFYLQGKDPRFIYGKYHADVKEYIPELVGAIAPDRNRIWLVFSHLQQPSDHFEEQFIVESLRTEWEVQSVIAPTNTQLFVAHRKTSP